MRLSALCRLAALAGFLLVLALVLFLALNPHPKPGTGIWDKAQHFIAFYVLTALGAAAFARRGVWPLAAFLFALGGLIEVLQATPWVHRDAEFADWFADTLAIAAVVGPMALPRFRAWLAG